VDGPEILTLFDRLTLQLSEALSDLEEWGLSGRKDTQYQHDVVADDIMIAPLLDAGFRVLTEESGLVADNPDADVTVVVDPVDGSTNASHGLPWFATSLCAVDGLGPLAASVTNLASGDRFEAVRNEGIRVASAVGRIGKPSEVAEMGDALLAFSGLPPDHGGWRQFRVFGAAALDMCAVATGAFDGFVDVDGAHGVWDYLGAALICSEAGASVLDAHGRDLLTFDPAERRAPIVASTPELMEHLLAMTARWGVTTKGWSD
jgi:fructose-1,6-bisphosphatase/inositol monophosphatase family enzyme